MLNGMRRMCLGTCYHNDVYQLLYIAIYDICLSVVSDLIIIVEYDCRHDYRDGNDILSLRSNDIRVTTRMG